jgi:hypothetical protein
MFTIRAVALGSETKDARVLLVSCARSCARSFPWLVLAGLLARLAADTDTAADTPVRLSFAAAILRRHLARTGIGTGSGATAIGQGSTAIGLGSSALGQGSVANGVASTAVGQASNATGV